MMGPLTFTPKWLEKEKDPPVFHFKMATVLERDAFEAELDGTHRAGSVLSFAKLLAALEGVQALMEGDDVAVLSELLRSEFGDGDLSPAEKARVKATTDILAEHWPAYRALVEQEARRHAIMPTLAFMRWVDRWEGLRDQAGEPIAFARNALGAIEEDALRRIPFVTLRAVGAEAYAIQYGRSQVKNSAPLSSSSPARKRSSTSRVRSKVAGS